MTSHEDLVSKNFIETIKCDICDVPQPEEQVFIITQRFGSEAVCLDCLPKYKRAAADAGDVEVLEEIVNLENR